MWIFFFSPVDMRALLRGRDGKFCLWFLNQSGFYTQSQLCTGMVSYLIDRQRLID